MIYYKKKNFIKKISNYLTTKFQERKNTFLFPFKKIFIFLGVLLLGVYLSYLFLLPLALTEEKTEKLINSFILNNTKLTLELTDLKVKPNYKFDINIKSKNLKLKYPNQKVFFSADNIDADITIFSLFQKQIDLNKLKTDEIKISTTFTKNKKYDCFKYLNLTNQNQNNKYKIRKLNIECKKFNLNIYDENIKKTFIINSANLKTTSGDLNKPLVIITNGQILSSNHKISDFTLNLSIKLNPKKISDFKTKLSNLNYNPLKDADKYSFYSKADIALKINPDDKKNSIIGKINLNDYNFKIDNMTLPKNNLVLIFKDGKIYTNSKFNFFKNQYINIESKISISKNKSIEAKLNSSDINLADLNKISDTICKIFNLKYKSKEISINGNLLANIYIKSNFKTLSSNGNLIIKNAKLTHNKTNFSLNNINSNINFNNNSIDIINTFAYVNNAKFNISGNIDAKTNLNLKITSDLIDVVKINSLLKDLPFSEKIIPILNKNTLKKGMLKINSTINGTIQNPNIISNSFISNLELQLKNKKIITVSNLTAKINKDEITIPTTKIFFDKIPLNIQGTIENFSKNPEGIFKITSNTAIKNEYLIINDKANLDSQITIKNNKIIVNYFNLKNNEKNIAKINGTIQDIDKVPFLNELKINIEEKLNLTLPKLDLTLDTIGNLNLNGKIEKPDISGKLTLYNVISRKNNLNIEDVILNIKNSDFYINIEKGKILNTDFSLVSQGKILNNDIIIDFAQIYSPFADIEKIIKNYKPTKTNSNNFIINQIIAEINSANYNDMHFSDIFFEGKYENNHLIIKNLKINVFEGKIEAKGNVNLKTQKTDLLLNLNEISIRHMSTRFKELSIAASGKLDALINLDFTGFNYENILNNLNSNIAFKIYNGELSQLAKLERFLQAGNIVSQSILKLTLNSTLSTITKQNTGDFKVIEGKIQIKNSNANIPYIISQGTNMSLYITGNYNLNSNYINAKILGRIPNSIVNVMGNFGNFSLNQKINSNSTTTIEKLLSTKIPKEDLDKIPPLAYSSNLHNTRKFIVFANGLITSINSIQDFKWHSEL